MGLIEPKKKAKPTKKGKKDPKDKDKVIKKIELKDT